MGQSTGMALLPAVEVSLAALGLDGNDQDLAEKAREAVAAIDEADDGALALARFGPGLLAVLDELGATPAGRAAWKAAACIICAKPIPVRRRCRATTCSAACSDAYREARSRNREHIRRSTVSDITPEQELAMRRRARKCPMCGVRLTDKPDLPSSKHLDHIIPLCVGGTHTHGNARVLCRACNLHRPKDGSDYSGPVTLWAQGEIPVGRPDRRHTGRLSNKETCRNGLHPWTPDNIAIIKGAKGQPARKVCRQCRKANERRNTRTRLCECGAPLASGGRTAACPACTAAVVRRAVELHQAGLAWKQVAALVGYGSGTGIRDVCLRAGYVPAPRQVADKRPKCPECGRPAAARGRQCGECAEVKAWRAVEMRRAGMTLLEIAGELGYGSITSVTNLMKTVVQIEPKMGAPRKNEALL